MLWVLSFLIDGWKKWTINLASKKSRSHVTVFSSCGTTWKNIVYVEEIHGLRHLL
jgi:hypothetical protein